MRRSDSINISAILLFISFLLCFSGISRADLCHFQGLGDLAGGDFFSKAYGVSADGNVVVGESKSALGEPFEGFRWENDVMSSLTAPGDPFFASSAYAVSADGLVVVGLGYSQAKPFSEAFRWTASDGVQGLGGFPPVFAGSRAYGVSGDGSVIVGESPSTTDMEAFRWTQSEGMVGIGRLGWRDSTAYGVSADGSVIVGESDSPRTTNDEAFRWTQEEDMVGLGFLDEPPDVDFSSSEARAVSSDGRVIVGVTSSPTGGQVFRWENGVMTGLGYPPAMPYAVSADGSVIAGEVGWLEPWRGAFIWDEKNGIRLLKNVLVNECDLDLTGWTLERATGVSADGRTFVGYGTNPDGLTEGWIAVIPEPATLSLLTLGAMILLKKRRA